MGLKTDRLLVSFNGTNGSFPTWSGVVLDQEGNLYGTTEQGGNNGYGTVFKLTPPTSGETVWRLTTLVSFNGINGAYPGAGLIFDQAGNLYGTTYSGGKKNYNGNVFKLSPPTPGKTAWRLKTLTSFGGFPDGGNPFFAALTIDSTGNLYGTTSEGGKFGAGTVFKLTPPAPGKSAWKRKTLLNFKGINGDSPTGRLVLDSTGNLYGTTFNGGKHDNHGLVFKLSPPNPGYNAWKRTTLVNFNGNNGANPHAGLVLDSEGILYGTTEYYGKYGSGTLFKLVP